MRKNFSAIWPPKDLVSALWLSAAGLLLANIVAFVFVVHPPGGSAQELRAEASELRMQVRQQRSALARTRDIAGKVETGRNEAESFMDTYFLDRRTLAATIVSEIIEMAKESGVRQKETQYATEPVEGTDDLSMLTVSANFEGTYADLMKLLNRIDRSSRLIIIESLQAAPQQGSNILNINLRLNGFVRENVAGPLPLPKTDQNGATKTAQNMTPGGTAQ